MNSGIRSWFIEHSSEMVCVRLIGDAQYREVKVRGMSTDYVCLENVLGVVDNVPLTAILSFREPLK